VIEEHDELGTAAGKHQELYLVLRGSATFDLDREKTTVPAGSCVFIRDPTIRRGALAEEDGTIVLVVGGTPGEAYAVSAWEAAADAYPHWESGDHQKAVEMLRSVVDEHPEAGIVLYNLACVETLVGESDAALDHLRRAIELEERFRELARTDEDFDAIRDRQEFRELLSPSQDRIDPVPTNDKGGTADGYEIASLDEIEIPGLANTARWAQIRSQFDIQSFGVNAWTANAGDDVISEHDEVSGGAAEHEELYVVLSGRATFTVDGETVDGPAGTIVFVRDPATKRKAVAEEAGTRILAVGAKRGEAFTPSGWERSAPAFPYFASKEYDKAAEALEEALAEYPDDPAVRYNLACAESMRGRTAEAIQHLRRSIEVENGERFRELARTDTDFDPIRDEPEFKTIVG
jgi:tetratricopeptide (TPR) repeat protein